jgi:hypothetical protein
MGAENGGAAADDLHSGDLQDALVDAVQPRDLAVLVGEQRVPVEVGFAGGPAVAFRDLEVLAEMRGVGEELLRDAADVDAGAAELPRLGDGDARAIRGCDAARPDAAGAAAYREKVVIEACDVLTSGSAD